jgi:hypothetical protein
MEPPGCPVLRQEFFARLLPDFDMAWDEARIADLDHAARASLRGLRNGMERAAERCLFPGRGLHRHLRFYALPLLVETDDCVPESQVDCALAWAAEATRGFISPVPGANATCAPAFFRYQDLMAVPLSTVQVALANAACDGNPAAALRQIPFRVQPAAARCSPIYLRFAVGVALSDGDADEVPQESSRWSASEDVVRVMLGSRLRVPVRVTTTFRTSFYRAAHDGLRTYQAARLDRIVAAFGERDGVSATLDLRDAEAQRRARLTLTRGCTVLAACMLQVPLDEGPSEMLARMAEWLRDEGIANIASLSYGGACNAACAPILAVPV